MHAHGIGRSEGYRLRPGRLGWVIACGLADWGGLSVAAWPTGLGQIVRLRTGLNNDSKGITLAKHWQNVRHQQGARARVTSARHDEAPQPCREKHRQTFVKGDRRG